MEALKRYGAALASADRFEVAIQGKGGHGGMDFIMAYRLVQTMREGLAPDYDVYDAAAWSAPFPLSQISIAKGSAPVKFPDFTRGGWTTKSAR